MRRNYKVKKTFKPQITTWTSFIRPLACTGREISWIKFVFYCVKNTVHFPNHWEWMLPYADLCCCRPCWCVASQRTCASSIRQLYGVKKIPLARQNFIPENTEFRREFRRSTDAGDGSRWTDLEPILPVYTKKSLRLTFETGLWWDLWSRLWIENDSQIQRQ